MKTIKKYSYDIFKMMLNQFGMAMLALVMTIATWGNDRIFLITTSLCAVLYIYLLYAMMYDIGQRDKPSIDGGRARFNPLKGLWIALGANVINIICGVMVAVFSAYIVMQSPVAVLDSNGEEMKVYASSETTDNAGETHRMYYEVELFSNTGGKAYIEESENRKDSETVNKDGAVVILYEKTGDESEPYRELDLYSESGMRLCTNRKSVKNWASNLYGIPYAVATFTQPMFHGIRDTFFKNNDNLFYLFTPILPVLFTALAYFMGVKGKRILFFLPERKQKPWY